MKVGELFNTSNWFELERVYTAVAADVQTPMLKQMAEVMLASNFNRPAELREKLQKLIAEHQAELGFENVCNMTVMGAMVEGYEGNYAVAADEDNRRFEMIVKIRFIAKLRFMCVNLCYFDWNCKILRGLC